MKKQLHNLKKIKYTGHFARLHNSSKPYIMKKILVLITAFLCSYQISKAQTGKGTQNLGLSLGYSHNDNMYNLAPSANYYGSSQRTKISNFNIGPNYSYFIADRSEIGGSLYFNTSTTINIFSTITNYNFTRQVSNIYGAFLYFRRYFMYENKIGFRTGPFAGYSRGPGKLSSNPTGTYDGNNTSNDYNAGGNLDLVYYPSNKLGISATFISLQYSKDVTRSGSTYTRNENFGINFIDSGLTLTAFYVFGGK
jgi:hypothetical protein